MFCKIVWAGAEAAAATAEYSMAICASQFSLRLVLSKNWNEEERTKALAFTYLDFFSVVSKKSILQNKQNHEWQNTYEMNLCLFVKLNEK